MKEGKVAVCRGFASRGGEKGEGTPANTEFQRTAGETRRPSSMNDAKK